MGISRAQPPSRPSGSARSRSAPGSPRKACRDADLRQGRRADSVQELHRLRHRPGEIAPMSLLTWDDVRPHAKAIRDEVGDGHMPPWHAAAPKDVSQRARVDGRRAADAARVGEQRGARGVKDLPKPPVYPGWAMGTPDVVFEMGVGRFPARGSSSTSISTSRRTSPSRSGFRRSRSGPATARSCTTRSPSTRPSRT